MDDSKKRQLVNSVRELGFVVSKPGKYIRFTTYCHETTLKDFKKCADERGYKLQEAVTEALDYWLEHQKKEKA